MSTCECVCVGALFAEPTPALWPHPCLLGGLLNVHEPGLCLWWGLHTSRQLVGGRPWPHPPSPAGVIRTAVPDLDRESQERYEVVIQATDMAGQLGGLSGSTTVTIVVTDVNDNPPRFPQSE